MYSTLRRVRFSWWSLRRFVYEIQLTRGRKLVLNLYCDVSIRGFTAIFEIVGVSTVPAAHHSRFPMLASSWLFRFNLGFKFDKRSNLCPLAEEARGSMGYVFDIQIPLPSWWTGKLWLTGGSSISSWKFGWDKSTRKTQWRAHCHSTCVRQLWIGIGISNAGCHLTPRPILISHSK